MKRYGSVQEMLDDIGDKQLAESFRKYQRRWSVRLRSWWIVKVHQVRALFSR